MSKISSNYEIMPIKELSREVVASWKHLQLLQIHLEGNKIYDAASRVGNKNAVAGLLRHTDNQSYILIEQYRYPLKARVLELVAGVIDKPNLSIVDIMKEEVKEETGYSEIWNIEFLAQTSGSAWALCETTNVYDVEISWLKWTQDLWDMEDIKVLEVPYEDFNNFLASKMKEWLIIDPKVCMAVYMTLGKINKII